MYKIMKSTGKMQISRLYSNFYRQNMDTDSRPHVKKTDIPTRF